MVSRPTRRCVARASATASICSQCSMTIWEAGISTELGGAGRECRRPARGRMICVGQHQHDKQRQHADRAGQEISQRVAGTEIKHETADQRSCRCPDIVTRGIPAEARATSGLGEARDIGRRDRRENRGREAVNETEGEQRRGACNERIKERRHGEEESAQHHHPLAPQYVGKRTGGQLEEDAGDRRGGDDDADQFRKGAEVGGKSRQNRASRHLIAEAGQQARKDDGRECVHRISLDYAPTAPGLTGPSDYSIGCS